MRPWRLFARHQPFVLVVVLCTIAGAMSGCAQDKSWRLTNMAGVMPPLKFSLTDDTGRHVTADTYRGKIIMLYFGYTHCPDVCPTTLAKLAQVLSKLGKDAKKVRILFVTVDPMRDTQEVLKSYTGAFGPQFVGLRTNDNELRHVAKRYRVTFSRGKPDAKGDYEVTHSSAVFIFDGSGKIRLMASYNDQVPAIVHDLRHLIDAS